jgi:hypothetical protein
MPGNKYAFKIQFHFGSMLPKKENFFLIEGEGVVDYHSLLFSTLEPLFTRNFTTSTEITFWYEDKMFQTLWISNQWDAWQAMTACQKAHST